MTVPSSPSAPSITCPSCKRQYRWKPELAGRHVKCGCGGRVEFPKAQAAPQAATDPYDLVGIEDDHADSPAAPVALPAPTSPRQSRFGSPAAASDQPGWASAIFAALFSRNKVPTSQRQAIAQYLIFGLGFVLIGIVALVGCYLLEQRHAAFMARAKEAPGTVMREPTIVKTGKAAAQLNPDNWDFKFPVRYQADGQEYTADLNVRGNQLPAELNRDNPAAWQGVKISLRYDPLDFTHAEASSSAQAASWKVGYAVGAVFLAIGAWGLVTKRPT